MRLPAIFLSTHLEEIFELQSQVTESDKTDSDSGLSTGQLTPGSDTEGFLLQESQDEIDQKFEDDLNADEEFSRHATSSNSGLNLTSIPWSDFLACEEQIFRTPDPSGLFRSNLNACLWPAFLKNMHDQDHVQRFVEQRIQGWYGSEMNINMTCGQDHMPRLPISVSEVYLKGTGLSSQIQHRIDSSSQQRAMHILTTPPLAIPCITVGVATKCEHYVNLIADKCLVAFAALFWADEADSLLADLFRLMIKIKPTSKDDERTLSCSASSLLTVIRLSCSET